MTFFHTAITIIPVSFSALGTKNDNFVRCPPSALQWRTRRFRMLEEIARHDADVVCLQEVDHFEFLRKSLAPLGYEGRFVPKPDSPCLYLQENTGPDGCAIFYKADKFERVGAASSRVIEVWNVESNQVIIVKSESAFKKVRGQLSLRLLRSNASKISISSFDKDGNTLSSAIIHLGALIRTLWQPSHYYANRSNCQVRFGFINSGREF